MEDEACDRHEVLVLGEGETELFVDIVDLHTSAEDLGMVVDTLRDALLVVVLILYISEDFLYDVL